MRDRRGFTLVEIMMALVVMMVVVVGMATTTGNFLRVVGQADRKAAAIELADDRMTLILMDPNYDDLEANYVTTEGNFPTLQDYTRQTRIVQVGGAGQGVDFKRITVIVDGPGLREPVKRSASVSAP